MSKDAEYPSMALQAAYNVLMNENAALKKKLDITEERAEYGWRNVCILEKAYQDELAKRDAMTALARELLAALKNSFHGSDCDPGLYGLDDKCHCGRDAAIAKAEAMLK